MKHLKITEPGYGNFDGHFGTVEFKGGVSCAPVTTLEAQRLQALLRVEPIGDEIDEVHNMQVNFASAAPAKHAEVEHVPAAEQEIAAKQWTREELEAIADKHGIKGVREIATAMGISGKSIKELIDEILGR